jgi:hypothetical protein
MTDVALIFANAEAVVSDQIYEAADATRTHTE